MYTFTSELLTGVKEIDEQHKAEHDGFAEFYRPLKKQYEKEGISYDFISNFDREVMKWIVFHVKSEDLEMAKYIKKCRKIRK